jgi:hypothetical protein
VEVRASTDVEYYEIVTIPWAAPVRPPAPGADRTLEADPRQI